MDCLATAYIHIKYMHYLHVHIAYMYHDGLGGKEHASLASIVLFNKAD